MLADAEERVERLITERKFIPGGRYLYASGRDLHQTQNCALFDVEDSREGWSDLMHKATMSLMTGAGIGVDYSKIRPSGTPIGRTGGLASGPLALMQMVNEAGRHIQQGGARRSAIWAGLPWDHPDIVDFIRIKDWDAETRARKAADFNSAAALDMTNVSVLLDDHFFDLMDTESKDARHIYLMACEHMFRTAEPGFSVDIGENAGETLRNACTEVTSADDSDICNLGSINLSRIESYDEMREAVKYGILFLLAGTVYSHVPTEKISDIREKNRRLGLGLMGVHEFCLKNGHGYEPNDALLQVLEVYEESTAFAHEWADKLGLSRPVKTRAVAPTGTIGIIGETTTGIEPILAVAYKRRYKEAITDGFGGSVTRYQYVIDPTAKRLIETGVKPEDIQDAYSLTFERRLEMQAFIQDYVDHGVSSTINLSEPVEDPEEVIRKADILYKYLPRLRGVTCYPNGSRGGQPITPVPYELAAEQEGVAFVEDEGRCRGNVCSA